MKIIYKKGRLTFTNGWRRQKATMVSLDGIVEMLGANAHIIKHIFLHV
jgi:hypothetical protein